MGQQLHLGGIAVDIVFKDIKNVHLSVYPPTGQVRISAPSRMSLDTVRVFAISKLAWIKQQQEKILDQERETPREYLDRESHFVWGTRYLLKVVEQDAAPQVELKPGKMFLRVRRGADEATREAIVAKWYRDQIRTVMPEVLAKWGAILGLQPKRVFVQRMKTRWGSCNPVARTIRINTELAKKPKECLEYIVVHELVHLLEPTHDARFVDLMDQFMPNWRLHRDRLNRLPVRHEDWDY